MIVPSTNVTVPWVSGPAATSVAESTCPASFGGPAMSLPSSVAGSSVNVWSATAVTASAPGSGGSLTSLTVIATSTGGDAA